MRSTFLFQTESVRDVSKVSELLNSFLKIKQLFKLYGEQKILQCKKAKMMSFTTNISDIQKEVESYLEYGPKYF